MTAELEGLAGEIRRRFPSLDVRTDQCEIIRIHLKKRAISLKVKEGRFYGGVYALDGECDFETPVLAEFWGTDLEEFRRVAMGEVERWTASA